MSAFAILGAAGAPGDRPLSTTTELRQINVIPRPARVEPAAGEFILRPKTAIFVTSDSAELKRAAEYLHGLLAPATGRSLPVANNPANERAKGIVLSMTDADAALGDEGYEILVTPENALLRAPTPAGIFYAVQTLRQLLPTEIESARRPRGVKWSIPCLRIIDKPACAWRGFMLDCSRHFMSKEYIKRTIDLLAFHKLNVLHWHFIDSNGWRMQVDSYPKLTQIGAWRGKAARRYGGFYTKDDIREIVAHAKSRHVMIVPEFEMPGHSDAALACYPELSCSGESYKLPAEPLPNENLNYFTKLNSSRPFCAGKDEVFKFHEAVFNEAVELFDSPYVHVGGDERPKGVWEKCPKCQARMKAEGLKDEHDLQNWFMRRISDILARKGKRVISWAVTRSDPYHPTDMDDLGNNAIIQNWHDGTAFAAGKGWDVVNAHNGFVYFDYPEFKGMNKPKWMPLLPLEKVYSFEPTPAALNTTEAKHILGGEACLWTELVPQDKVDAQIFPRLLALAEAVWSPREGKDYADFARRVARHEARLARMGVKYGKPPLCAVGVIGDHAHNEDR
ncbi:MAG: beta-N-acetylhexosaminidase [bacterium]